MTWDPAAVQNMRALAAFLGVVFFGLPALVLLVMWLEDPEGGRAFWRELRARLRP